jgi:hypothetical protein
MAGRRSFKTDESFLELLATLGSQLHSDDLPVEVNRRQRELVLMEKPTAYATRPKRKSMRSTETHGHSPDR